MNIRLIHIMSSGTYFLNVITFCFPDNSMGAQKNYVIHQRISPSHSPRCFTAKSIPTHFFFSWRGRQVWWHTALTIRSENSNYQLCSLSLGAFESLITVYKYPAKSIPNTNLFKIYGDQNFILFEKKLFTKLIRIVIPPYLRSILNFPTPKIKAGYIGQIGKPCPGASMKTEANGKHNSKATSSLLLDDPSNEWRSHQPWLPSPHPPHSPEAGQQLLGSCFSRNPKSS